MSAPLFVRELASQERDVLQQWLSSPDHEKARRARIILFSANGKTAMEIGALLGTHPDVVKKWIRQFNKSGISGIEIQKRGPKSSLIQDRPFTQEQIDELLRLAKQSPESLNLPFSAWTPQKLAEYVMRCGIIPRISQTTVRNILANAGLNKEPSHRGDCLPYQELRREEQDVSGEDWDPVIAANFQAQYSQTPVSAAQLASEQGNPSQEPKGGDAPDERWGPAVAADFETQDIQALISASQTAIENGALGEAEARLRQALLLAANDSMETQAFISCLLSEVFERSSRYQESLEAVEIYEDPTVRARLSQKMQAQVRLRLGWAYSWLGNHPKAIARLNEALKGCMEVEDNAGASAAHYALGRTYIEIEEYKIARDHLLKAIEFQRLINDRELLAQIYWRLGVVDYYEGDFNSAKASYSKALEFVEGSSDTRLLGSILLNLGVIYITEERGEREEATRCIERAIEYLVRGNHKDLLMLAYNNLGDNLIRSGKWQKAYYYLDRAVNLTREVASKRREAEALTTLGELYFLQGQTQQAEESLLKAIDLFVELGEKWTRAYAERLLGGFYSTIGRPELASRRLRSALQSATAVGDLHGVIMSHLSLAEYHYNQESFNQAEEYLELAKDGLKKTPSLYASGFAQRLSGKLEAVRGRFAESQQHISQSISIFTAVDDKCEIGVSHLEMGALLSKMGEIAQARSHLIQAAKIFTSLGAGPNARRAQQMLDHLEKKVPSPVQRRIVTAPAPDILLFQRLIDASSSRELVLQELVAILYENFPVTRVIAFQEADDREGALEPVVAQGCTLSEATQFIREIASAIAQNRSSLANALLYLLRDGLQSQTVIYLGLKPGASATEFERLRPFLKQAELALENCALRSLGKPAAAVTDFSRAPIKTAIPGFIYASPAMADVISRIHKIRNSDVTVLITGESGTGKELVARTVHAESARRNAVFLPFNCTATPKEIIDSHLFGHRRGAFTGATNNYPGIIRAADGGTLFLDEIGDLSLEVQPKLMRFLQEGEIQPLGQTQPIKVNVRVLAATNSDLERAVEEGRFREDLYHRLNIIRIHVPPLRERKEEIPLLAAHYLDHFTSRSGKRGIDFTQDALEALTHYEWPGNVRQLRNEIERLVAYAVDNSSITIDDLSSEVTRFRPRAGRGIERYQVSKSEPYWPGAYKTIESRGASRSGHSDSSEAINPGWGLRSDSPSAHEHELHERAGSQRAEPSYPKPQSHIKGDETYGAGARTLREATEQLERRLIEDALARNGYNLTRTAQELGISRQGLRMKMAQLGVRTEEA